MHLEHQSAQAPAFSSSCSGSVTPKSSILATTCWNSLERFHQMTKSGNDTRRFANSKISPIVPLCHLLIFDEGPKLLFVQDLVSLWYKLCLYSAWCHFEFQGGPLTKPLVLSRHHLHQHWQSKSELHKAHLERPVICLSFCSSFSLKYRAKMSQSYPTLP